MTEPRAAALVTRLMEDSRDRNIERAAAIIDRAQGRDLTNRELAQIESYVVTASTFDNRAQRFGRFAHDLIDGVAS